MSVARELGAIPGARRGVLEGTGRPARERQTSGGVQGLSFVSVLSTARVC